MASVQSGSKLVAREACPKCQEQGRDKSSDNLAVYDDGHKWCYSCGHFENKHFEKEFESLTDTFSYEYIPWRGVNKETFAFYGVKAKINSEGAPVSIGFKYPNDSYKIRDFKEKSFHTTGEIAKAGLFGRDKFVAGSHKYVTITEGELDALSLYQTIRSPVVSVRSSVTAKSDCALDRSWLNSFERIYLAFDGDGPGRDAAAAVASLFDYNKLYSLKFPGGNRKDANDFSAAGEGEVLRQIWWNAKRYLPANIISDLSEFENIINREEKKGVPYPFPTLNYMTYGIRTGESVLITAKSGVGKTELCHAIEHQLLTETNDAIGAIYIEEPQKRHLQALAGIQLRRPVHLPEDGTSDEQIYAALQRVVGSDDRLHLYSHFGSNDPDVIIDTIRFLVSARSCRYVILDHITMVVSGLGGSDATQALDYLSTRLEMMVKELDFALIFVSHVNDDGLTRGSRNITNIADIRIDLHRDIVSADPITRSTTNVIVSKNRFCGRTGPAGDLLFDPVTYTLSEFTDAHSNDNYSRTTKLVA